jgi:hypothetical protein
MRIHPTQYRSKRLLLPLLGMGLFIVLYILAAFMYPGGSWLHKEQLGFSFRNNYLCDLLDYYAVNGDVNDGRFFARLALGLLCVSLIYLWYHLRDLFPRTSVNRTLMWISGQLALLTTFFLSSNTHDEIVRLAGVFGIVGILTLTIELFKMRYYMLVLIAIECIAAFLINYYCYETGDYLQLLPVIQKITFVSFMIWFALLTLLLYRKAKLIS